MDYKVVYKVDYEKEIEGHSIMGSLISVIGEQTVELLDGRIIDQYIYNIVGYTPENEKPFVALKENIYLHIEKGGN